MSFKSFLSKYCQVKTHLIYLCLGLGLYWIGVVVSLISYGHVSVCLCVCVFVCIRVRVRNQYLLFISVCINFQQQQNLLGTYSSLYGCTTVHCWVWQFLCSYFPVKSNLNYQPSAVCRNMSDLYSVKLKSVYFAWSSYDSEINLSKVISILEGVMGGQLSIVCSYKY